MEIKINKELKSVTIYNTFWKRFLGLMGKKNIKEIIVFPKCNSIHTFFMKEPIDVIMTSQNGNILHIYHSLKPWRIILPKKHVYYTFELPNNTIKNEKELQIFM